jgi:SAM-dependent methyltransferase
VNTPKQEIAAIDLLHLELLRANVNRFLARCGAAYDRPGALLLDVAPQDYSGAAPFFPRARVETLDINPQAGCTYVADLCQNNEATVPSGRFEIIVCTEVLEHTMNPFSAVDEIRRMLKTGGLALITVPFNFRIHGPLPDCWRISEHGLKSLFSVARGFDIESLEALEDEGRFLMPIHYTLIARRRS